MGDREGDRGRERERARMGERQRVTPNLTFINRHNRLHTGDTGEDTARTD